MSLTSYVPTPKFEEYRELFREHFIMERRDGIIELRMHTLGGDVQWNFELHRAIWQAFQTAGADPENQVMILTTTGFPPGHRMGISSSLQRNVLGRRKFACSKWRAAK